VVGHLLSTVRARPLLIDSSLDEVSKVEGVGHFDSRSSCRARLLPVGVFLSMSHHDVDLRVVSVGALVVVLHSTKL
jgi:hypothetical protein